MQIRRCDRSGVDKIDFDNLVFGRTFTDHMICCDFDGEQWGEFIIKPLEPIAMHPGTHVLHYGQAVFEGLKAYRTDNNRINLFRIKDNLARLNTSAERMAIPAIDEDKVLEAVKVWMDLDKAWVPGQDQGSLYLRPFLFATSPTLRAIPSIKYSFMLIACPVGFYYNKPISVKVETEFTRAAVGGVGFAKAAGNYGAAFMPTMMAKDEEFDQLLWTDRSEEQYLEELGSANLFFMADGVLYTPELHDSILAGITRDSVIQLAGEEGIEVKEQKLAKAFLLQQLESGRLESLFATGTAAAITFIRRIQVDGKNFEIQSEQSEKIKGIKSKLEAMKLARVPDSFSWNYIV